jgi:hypothetical protein
LRRARDATPQKARARRDWKVAAEEREGKVRRFTTAREAVAHLKRL